MTHHLRDAIIVVLVGHFAAGCTLHVARTETVSGPVVGLLFHTDGTPRSGAAVAVSTEWTDTLCSAAVLRTTTDSTGAFRFPATQRHYDVTWVVPLLDRSPPGYRLCVSVADTMQIAYHGSGSFYDTAPRDSITCPEWAWGGRSRVTCSGEAEHALAEGGRSTAAEASGWYRLIPTCGAAGVRGRRRPHLGPPAAA